MITNILLLYKCACKKNRIYFAIKNICWLLYAIFDIAKIYTLTYFFDVITENSKDVRQIFISIIIFGIVFALNNIFLTLSNLINEDSSFVMMENLANEFHKKINNIKSDNYEDTKFLDKLNLANEGMENACFLLNVVSMVLFYHIPYLIFVIYYMAKSSLFLIFALIFLFLPIAVSHIKKFKANESIASQLAVSSRKIIEFEKYIFKINYYKETYLLGAFEFFKRIILKEVSNEGKLKLSIAYKSFCFSCFMQFISFISYSFAIIIMLVAVIKYKYSIAGFYALLTSLTSVIAVIDGLFNVYLSQISEQAGNVKYILEFMKSENEQIPVENRGCDEISLELKNVNYKYPNSNKYSLSNINCTFQSNEIVVIVGENGSGKTTLTKLLQGMLENYEGKILLNGLDIQRINKKYWYSKCTSLFQEYQRYKFSLAENVVINKEPKENIVKSALDFVNLKIEKTIFKDGIDTILSREFGGCDLSGGQWQKIAMARAVAKDAKVIFLDEPTSSIDPIGESVFYNMFKKMSRDKLSIIVSHRLGICAIADRILVMDNGTIIEEGTHEQLMLLKGKYYNMFNNQKSLYK